MTAIFALPDTEYFRVEQPLVFEVPGELHRTAINTDLAGEVRSIAFNRICKEYAYPAVTHEIQHPHRELFEVLDEPPIAVFPHETQEDPEAIVERTVKGVPKSAIEKSNARDTVFWTIVVWTKKKRKLYQRYQEVKGPRDGFEANHEMPEDMAHKQLVYDLLKRN